MKLNVIASAVALACLVTGSAAVLATPGSALAAVSGKKATHTVSHSHKGGKKTKVTTGGYG